MKKKFYVRATAFIFALILIFSVSAIAIAANTVVPKNIATSDIMDDLKAMEAYDTNRYNKDETVDYCEILELIEFGYDANGNTREYGLYLYIYNPSGRAIETGSAYKNRVQLRAAPVKETVAGGDTAWNKYALKYLDKSSDNLFYKFKIDVPNSFMRIPDKNMRVYEISDVELFFENENKIRSVGASGKWMYIGYQEYHAEGSKNETSTLSWESDVLMTLDLDLNPATWKTETHEKGTGWAYELSSVYFNVPDKIIEDYGDPDDVTKGLVRVQGTYDNYFISGLSVKNKNTYDMLLPYEGISLNDSTPFAFNTYPYETSSAVYLYEAFCMFGYNAGNFFHYYPVWPSAYLFNYQILNYGNLFRGNLFGMTSSEYEKAITSRLEGGTLYSSKGSYSEGVLDVSADDGDIADAIITYSDKYGSYGFWDWVLGDSYYPDEHYGGISPIVAVDKDYVYIWDNETCGEKYFIGENDVDYFCDFVENSKDSETTFIIRFAVTDYYCDDIYICHENSSLGVDYNNGNYYFRDEIFLDFDILSLTWKNKNGVRTVIPVKATSINIVGNVTPPHEDNDNFGKNDDPGLWDCLTSIADLRWQVLMIGFVVIIVVIFMFPSIGKLFGKFFGLIGRFFGWLFRLPGKMFDGEKKLDERRARKRKLASDKEDRKYKNEERERERQERERKTEKHEEKKETQKNTTEEKTEEKT